MTLSSGFFLSVISDDLMDSIIKKMLINYFDYDIKWTI